MSYEMKFSAAVQQALDRRDIVKAVADPGLQFDESFIRERLLAEEAECRGLLAPAIQRYGELEAEIADIEIEHEVLEMPRGWAAAFEVIVGLLLLAAVAGGIGWAFGWDFPAKVVQSAYWETAAPVWLQLAGLAAALSILLSAVMRLRWRLRRPALRAQIAQDPRLEAKRSELASQGKEIDRQLNELVAANAFEIVGSRGPPFFQPRLVLEGTAEAEASKLKVSSANGLSEVADKAHEAPSVARREIFDLLKRLPGASIGLSGPRGSGKSTILRSLTSANLPLKGKEAIAIYTAAPVEYEARDFLLHLFATLCRQVLRTYGAAEADGADVLAEQAGHGGDWSRRLAGIAPLLLWLGTVVTSLAILVAWMVWAWGSSAADSTTPSFFAVLDLKPGSLLLFGLTALVLGYSLMMQANLRRRAGGERPASLFYAIYPWLRPKAPPAPPEPELVQATRAELRDIRFQRSFTSGWSGAIKIPAGFELGKTNSAALAQRQESLPELVDRFCRYVAKIAAQHGAVVIAVDELDKLKSAQEAEQFINSVKSIFAIPNCFYLISVSEDALSAFERRGLSLRDAFDSAFDDIRYIGYKELPGSRQLLQRRILNLPDPFLCLCHVLSGGLPRDLIRIARAMFQAASAIPGKATIGNVAEQLVQQEAKAKIRASRTAIRSIALEPDVGTFAAALADLEDAPVGSPACQQALASIVSEPREGPDLASSARLIAIQRELAAYLDFLGLVLQLAHKMAGRGGSRGAMDKEVEGLARARQALETSISVGLLRLEKLRPSLA